MAAVAAQIGKAIEGAFEGDSHALLVAVYKDPKRPIELRLEAAKAAIAYERPKLAPIEHFSPDGTALTPTVSLIITANLFLRLRDRCGSASSAI